MNRQRLAAALVLTFGAALGAQADVVAKSSVTTIAGGKTTEGVWVESVQGLRMRGHWASPKAPGCRSVGLIHDATGNRVVVLRCDKQEAEVVDAVKAAAEVEKRLPARLVTTTIEPTGRSQDMLGVRCEEFAFSVKAPLNENIMLIRRGTAWVAKSGPGVEEYVAGVPYEMHVKLEVQGAWDLRKSDEEALGIRTEHQGDNDRERPIGQPGVRRTQGLEDQDTMRRTDLVETGVARTPSAPGVVLYLAGARK